LNSENFGGGCCDFFTWIDWGVAGGRPAGGAEAEAGAAHGTRVWIWTGLDLDHLALICSWSEGGLSMSLVLLRFRRDMNTWCMRICTAGPA
jgi:hypothetical protein